MAKFGRPNKITPEHYDALREIARQHPSASLGEITLVVKQRLGMELCAPTVKNAFAAAGIKRVRVTVKREAVVAARYGYNESHRRKVDDQTYCSSLTDAEWALVSDLFEKSGPGKPETHSRRHVLDGCCYAVRTGCPWRELPKEFPHWDNVYKTFRRWSDRGLFEAMNDRLSQAWRVREGRAAVPTVAIMDSQSTRISPQGGVKGYDAGKKVKGRKRNLVVDTMGLLLAVVVTAASVQDRDAAPAAMLAALSKRPSIEALYVDRGYEGKCALMLQREHGLRVHVVRNPANRRGGMWSEQGELFEITADARGFVPLPVRWIVERTHAWGERSRRLVMHHDRLPRVSETWVWLAQARMLLNRLTN